jgi:hypothetical protein
VVPSTMLGGVTALSSQQRNRYEPLTGNERQHELDRLVGTSDSELNSILNYDGDSGQEESDRSLLSSTVDKNKQSGLSQLGFATVAIALCLLSVVLNASLLIVSMLRVGLSPDPIVNIYALNKYNFAKGEKIKRPSQFKGLDKYNRTSLDGVPMDERMSTVNFPIIVGAVDVSLSGRINVVAGKKENRGNDWVSKVFEDTTVEVDAVVSDCVQLANVFLESNYCSD